MKSPKVILKQKICLAMTVFLLALLKLNGSVFAAIDPSYYTLTATLQNQNQAIEYLPMTWDEDKYVGTMRTLNVTTNSPSGYRVYVNVPTSEASAGSLIIAGGSSSDPTINPINTTPSTAGTLNTNTWGFGIPNTTTFLPTNNFSSSYNASTPSISSTYAGVKVSPNYTLIRNVTGTVSGTDSFDIYYGMRLGTDVLTHPGTYQTHVDYHVVSEASNVIGGEATITPSSGPKAGGTAVTITTSLMSDFVPSDLNVTIGGGACTSPSGSVSTGVLVISCLTPRHHPGLNNVVVNIDSLGLSYTINDGFEFIETGNVKITNVSYVSGINVSGTPSPSIDSDGEINFDLTFLGGLDNTDTLSATYRITVTNSTDDDYIFTPPTSNMKLVVSQNDIRDIAYTLSGISAGDTIPANSSVSFNIILSADYVSGEHGTEGGIEIDPISQATPSIIGSIHGSNAGDLSGNNTLTSFQIDVESTFGESKTFTINSLNSDFEIVNSSGNPLGAQTIGAETTGTYTFYMKKANGAAFASETAAAGITINYDGTYTNVGEVKIKVDRDPSYVDSQPPTISGVTITKNKTTVGEATLTWSGTDNVGIASYGIYKCTTTCDSMISVSGLTNSYTFTGMPADAATYHFVVVGFDDEGNTASQSQINGANTSPGPASSTGDVELKWRYSVTYDITNGGMNNTSGTTVMAGGTWEGTITANSGYNRPSNKNSITVIMDNQTYTGFNYNTNNYRITIENASGDINISATLQETCLIAGTLIAVLDENGNETTKPIENITYSDLVKVWNHETGTIDYMHPARIEKTTLKNQYQLTTFSDGSTLGTVGWHGIFSVNDNEFITVNDPSKFYPGTEVYKVVGDQLVAVTVQSIETVVEDVNVYHLLSSQYYNVIANDFLTTDGFVITSNFYGFTDENIMWPAARAEFISNPANLYTYEDFADIGIPLRMYNDLRLREASYLQRYGITLDMFKSYLISQGVLDGMVPYDDE